MVAVFVPGVQCGTADSPSQPFRYATAWQQNSRVQLRQVGAVSGSIGDGSGACFEAGGPLNPANRPCKAPVGGSIADNTGIEIVP